MEDPNETRRKEEIEDGKRANHDLLNISWINFVQELYKSFLGKYAIEDHRFLNVMESAVEFVRVCYLLEDSYTEEEKHALLSRMRENMRFDTELLSSEEKKDFYRQLKAFISGTQKHFTSLRDDEDGEYFQRLCDWIPDVLAYAIPSYFPPESNEQNTFVAREYCEIFRAAEKTRLLTLQRVGIAIAIYVDCHSLQNPNRPNFEALSRKQVIALRLNELRERYLSLRSGLYIAGRLDPELDAKLVAEEKNYIHLISEVDHIAPTPFGFTDEIHRILADILRHDRASALSYYAEYGKKIPNPDRPLYDVLARDYYPVSVSDSDSAPEHEITRVVSQAPTTARALRQLDNAYRRLFLEYKKLLGLPNRLTKEKLNVVLIHYGPLERLEVLETMCRAIVINEGNKYPADRKLAFFGKSNKSTADYSRLQLAHIKLLQECYFDIINEHPSELLESHIRNSLLLDVKINEKGKIPLKVFALERLNERLKKEQAEPEKRSPMLSRQSGRPNQ